MNRAAVELAMMETDQAHSLLLLNVVFMTASKHLFRAREFDRAIKFRERARGKNVLLTHVPMSRNPLPFVLADSQSFSPFQKKKKKKKSCKTW